MICNVRIIQFASSAVAACALLSSAPASAQGVKIGVLNDQSGVYADFGGKGSVEAAKMAIEDFGGSVLGERIELINADHQMKADLGTAIARRWYDVEGVDMITDLTSSTVACRAADRCREEEDRYRCRLVDIGAHRRGLHALRLPLGL
jgi:branched-chain amino acid transport system substrate-binding protein